MPKRHVFVTVFCCLMAVVAVVGYTHDTVGKTPVRLPLKNARGRVVLNHQRHAEDYKVAYETCYHGSAKARENVQPCDACHGVDFDDSFREDHIVAFADDETTYATCHHMDNAPAKRDHAAHAEEYDLSCTDCHHANADIEPGPVRCTAYHLNKPIGGIPGMKTAAHTKYADCHQKWFDAGMKGCTSCRPFTDNRKLLASRQPVDVSPGDADCTVCHGDVKASELIPDRMGAFHSSCMKCHEEHDRGPFHEDQCDQYHTK